MKRIGVAMSSNNKDKNVDDRAGSDVELSSSSVGPTGEPNPNPQLHQQSQPNPSSPAGSTATAAKSPREGYITVKIRTGSKVLGVGLLQRESWERRYVVIQDDVGIYFYKDLRAYQHDPELPINTRPIELAGYMLTLPAKAEPPYPITLTPADADDHRKEWRFKCDTIGEMQKWVAMLDAGIAAATLADSKLK